MTQFADYIVQIDTGRDGRYGTEFDDVSRDVISLAWANGMNTPYQEVSSPQQATISLDNSSRRYDVDRAGALYADKLYPSTLVRIIMVVNAVRQQMWEGRIEDVTPMMGRVNETPVVRITCLDLMADLERFEFFPPLVTDVRVDAALDALFDAAPTHYPYESVGALGLATLGETFVLYGADNLRTFEQAQSTIAYAGAIASEERNQKDSARTFIVDCVGQECGGRLFYDARTHLFTFHNRHHDLQLTSTPTLFDTNDVYQAEATYGRDRANEILLRWTPREVGTAASTLYNAENVPFTLRAGQTRRIVGRYTDPDNPNVRISAETVIAPALGTDVLTSNNSGITLAVDAKATAAEIEITNNTAAAIEVTQIRVRGTPLLEYQTETIELVDWDSVRDYGKRSRSFWTRIQNQLDAESYATILLKTFKEPLRRLSQLRYNVWSAAEAEHARDLGIGSLIRVDDTTHSGHEADYVIVGERHNVDTNEQHTITYILKGQDRSSGFVLGTENFGRLGVNTRLVF